MANTIKIKATKATKAQLNSFARQALNGTLPDMPTAWECAKCGGTGHNPKTGKGCSCWHAGYVKFAEFMNTGKAQFTIIAKGNGKLN